MRVKAPSPTVVLPADRFKAVSLLQFLFVCTSVISNVAFVLSLLKNGNCHSQSSERHICNKLKKKKKKKKKGKKKIIYTKLNFECYLDFITRFKCQ